MNAPEILERLTKAGIRLSAKGGNIIAKPKAAVTPEVVELIRAHKPELLQCLTADPAASARRQKVLAMLEERPGSKYAVVTDTDNDPEAVILALAIRDMGTVELRIPREKYDPFLLLDLIERHGGTIH